MGSAAAAGAKPRVTATISVGSGPYAVAVDPGTHTAYVANGDAATVSVINETTNKVTATIKVGDGPSAVAVDPGTHTVYVTNVGDKSVSVINGAPDTATTNKVTATITVGVNPEGVAVDPGTHTVYVANSHDKTVSVINGATNTVTATIKVGTDPVGVAVDSGTHTVYVTNASDHTVSVIDGAPTSATSSTVTATVKVGATPEGVAVDPGTHTAYVTNNDDNTVSVIDGATNTVTITIEVGDGPEGVAVDPGTHAVYVTNVFDVVGTVSMIDGAPATGTTNTVTATIKVGALPDGVAVDSGTHAAYVTNFKDNTVSVITTPTADEPVTISGDTTQNPIYGSTFLITGTAPVNSTVSLNFHKAGTPAGDYSIVRTVVADSNGRWTRSIAADADYRYFARSGDLQSAKVLNQPTPALDGAASRVVAKNKPYTLTGGAAPGSTVFLHFHKAGTPASDYSIVRTAVANSVGDWSRTYSATTDYRLYISRSANDSPRFTSYLLTAR